MAVTLINPDGVYKPDTYWQASVSQGTKIIHLSGQGSWDEAGRTVGPGNLATQSEQAFINVGRALIGLGASFEDVAKLHVYIVNWSPEMRPAYLEGKARAAKALNVDLTKPVTLIGVQALVVPELMIEIEAIAVL